MHRPLLVLPLLFAALSGCLAADTPAPGDDPVPAPTEAAWTGPLMTRTGCSGFNAILFTDAASMQPYVPSNWTFTAFQNQAILRVHTAGCDNPDAADGDGYDFHLILSTPMAPDEASAHHHDNPDVVLGIWSDNATSVAAWNRHGVSAHNATFQWAETTTGDTVTVTSPEGSVMQFEGINPHQPLPTQAYVWPATYAAGTTEITWFWGHENATSRIASVVPPTFGPATPIAGISTTPWNVAIWMGFDVTYAPGTPPTEG